MGLRHFFVGTKMGAEVSCIPDYGDFFESRSPGYEADDEPVERDSEGLATITKVEEENETLPLHRESSAEAKRMVLFMKGAGMKPANALVVKKLPLAAVPNFSVAVPRSMSPSPAEKKTWPPVIVCLGDSLTRGPMDRPQDSYPFQLQQLLTAAGSKALVSNNGTWGATSTKLMTLLGDAISAGQRLGCIACVLVLGGTNDILYPQSGTMVDAFHRLKELQAAAAKAAAAPVGALTLPPLSSPAFNQSVQELNKLLKQSPPGFLVDLNIPLTALDSGGTHLLKHGYQMMAQQVFKVVGPRFGLPSSEPKLITTWS